MKNTLSVAFVIAVLFCSCNDEGGKTAQKKIVADSIAPSLEYMSSGNSISQLLCQRWENKEDVDDGILNSGTGNGDLEIPFRGYTFFDDGVMVQNPRDNMKTGKWKMDEKAKIIHLVFDNGGATDITIDAVGVKSLLLKAGKDKPVKYMADGKKHKTVSDDPFYPTNNKWRIKPTHLETDSEIKSRVIQCVLFYNKFFQDNGDRNEKVISFYGIPSCFKWYQGGISVNNKDKLSKKWIDCFFNKDQAVMGQQLLENIISKKYKWNREEPSWIKQSAGVLLQIADSLK